MRLGSAAKALAGALAVIGMLALSSPGVRVARAKEGDPVSSEVSPAPLPGGSAAGASRVEGEAVPLPKGSPTPEAIAERIRAEMQSSGEKPVVLNGRGYNYATPRDPLRELGMVRSEAARQRGESPASR